MAPPILAYRVHSLPPILHMQAQNPMSSYSKGAQGLSVFLRVHGIFTATAISPSLWPRQCGDRYAIRAGRNLPDKEFRYLRMVIVTTAVYWGLNSQLRSQRLLTGPLNLPAPGRRQSIYINLTSSHGPVFLINSRFPLFSATPQPQSKRKECRSRVVPLLPKLRGHFAEFLNHSSPERLSIFNLTTCVGLGYGPYIHIARGFSRQY